MGQYHLVANLTKREYINSQSLGIGLKAIEQLTSSVIPAAMFMLAVCPTPRGCGDLRSSVAGRWHGDHVVVIGDYAKDGDFTGTGSGTESELFVHVLDEFTDISEEVQSGLYESSGLFRPVSPWSDSSAVIESIKHFDELDYIKGG